MAQPFEPLRESDVDGVIVRGVESPPDAGEPFSAVLDDLDRLILPAVTHWQHPRFLAYFPNTASGPAILAELMERYPVIRVADQAA